MLNTSISKLIVIDPWINNTQSKQNKTNWEELFPQHNRRINTILILTETRIKGKKVLQKSNREDSVFSTREK